jgi:hypothetical protein
MKINLEDHLVLFRLWAISPEVWEHCGMFREKSRTIQQEEASGTAKQTNTFDI